MKLSFRLWLESCSWHMSTHISVFGRCSVVWTTSWRRRLLASTGFSSSLQLDVVESVGIHQGKIHMRLVVDAMVWTATLPAHSTPKTCLFRLWHAMNSVRSIPHGLDHLKGMQCQGLQQSAINSGNGQATAGWWSSASDCGWSHAVGTCLHTYVYLGAVLWCNAPHPPVAVSPTAHPLRSSLCGVTCQRC